VKAPDPHVEHLLEALTLEEKVSLTSGADLWNTPAVPRLGIPSLRVTDGPSGARGGSFTEGATSTSFPCGAALGATWSPALVERVGAALADEARSKGAHVLLGPTVNLHRSPLAGRNFEAYAEDPCLAARIAAAFVRGVQSRGVAACVKHFAGNESEFERNTIDSVIGERALRELYLAPFEAAVREAGAWCVMTAYNRLNGTYCAENAWLLGDVLRGEWGFDGLVMSDWFGTQSTVASANAGLDLEMPGPARWYGAALLEAVRKGEVSESTLDAKVRRLLLLMARTGALDGIGGGAERAEETPQRRALAREAAREAIVLLSNSRGVLPLDPARLRRLALIGSHADVAVIQGGGSAQVNPHRAVSPLEGIRARLGDAVRVRFERGASSHKLVPIFDDRFLEGELVEQYFANAELTGAPALERRSRRAYHLWLAGAVPAGLEAGKFSVRTTGRFVAPESGAYTWSLASLGRSRLFVDGALVVDNWTKQERGEFFFGLGSTEVRASVELAGGRAYDVAIEFRAENPFLAGVRAGVALPEPPDLLERAVRCAADADAAVVVVGLNEDWETEGRDRADLELPGRQVELLERVAAAQPNSVVVVNAGAPIRLDWLDRVPAALWLWYPGQEGGHALADVLFGDADPGGRLPTTFPKRIEDNPSHLHYPGENGRVVYGEGIFAGYRYYAKKRIEPRLWFGHGLSYARYRYGALALSAARSHLDRPLEVSLEVTNVAERAGSEVVQLYVRDLASRLARPENELRAFAKLALAPGQTRTARFQLERRDFACWDPDAREWVAEPGEFELVAARSAGEPIARARFALDG
jgi:beta-glucosidase